MGLQRSGQVAVTDIQAVVSIQPRGYFDILNDTLDYSYLATALLQGSNATANISSTDGLLASKEYQHYARWEASQAFRILAALLAAAGLCIPQRTAATRPSMPCSHLQRHGSPHATPAAGSKRGCHPAALSASHPPHGCHPLHRSK